MFANTAQCTENFTLNNDVNSNFREAQLCVMISATVAVYCLVVNSRKFYKLVLSMQIVLEFQYPGTRFIMKPRVRAHAFYFRLLGTLLKYQYM